MENDVLTYIANAKSYTLAVAPSKNRIYCTLGPDVTVFPDASEIRDDWLEIGDCLSNEFTLVLDACAEKVQRPDVIHFLLDFQKAAAGRGLLKLADIVSGSSFAYMLHEQIADMAGTRKRRKVFPDRESAEKWLDSLEA